MLFSHSLYSLFPFLIDKWLLREKGQKIEEKTMRKMEEGTIMQHEKIYVSRYVGTMFFHIQTHRDAQ